MERIPKECFYPGKRKPETTNAKYAVMVSGEYAGISFFCKKVNENERI